MTFAKALSLISQALVEALGWFGEFVEGQWWIALITIFGIYTVSRLLLMPLIGKSGSDAAKRKDE
jgi:hypothetical protein